jgi:hypothetical protein
METPQAKSAQSDSGHYREMAQRLRELAHEIRFPGARKELLALASRYERRAANLDSRAKTGSHESQR